MDGGVGNNAEKSGQGEGGGLDILFSVVSGREKRAYKSHFIVHHLHVLKIER